jgi:hypothetical protein
MYTLQAASPITWVNGVGQVVQFQNGGANVTFVTGGFKFPYTDTTGYGKFIGNTLTGNLNNLSVNGIANEYEDAGLWGVAP